jgi:Sec-independent protein translocase protein TatA
VDHGIIGYIFIVVALIFIFGGSKRLEDLGRGFGGFMREFTKAKKEAEESATKTIDEPKAESKSEAKEEVPPKS